MQKIWKAMAGVLGKFKQALQGRPLLTNCLTYGMLYGGAEFSQQTFIRKYSVRHFWLINAEIVDFFLHKETFFTIATLLTTII